MPPARVNQYGVDPMGRGALNMSSLSIPQQWHNLHESPSAEVDEETEESEHPATGGSPLVFVFFLLGLIIAMWLVHRSSPFIRSEAFGVNWVTWLEVGVMASFFILVIKAVFGRWHVRGITNAVMAI